MKILMNRSYFRDEDFPLAVNVRDPQPEFPRHSHQFHELVFITRGSGTHQVGDSSSPIRAGDVFVIPDSQEHEYVNRNDLALINILFDPYSLGLGTGDIGKIPGFHAMFNLEIGRSRDKARLAGHQHLLPHQMEKAKRMIQQIEDELTAKPVGFQRMALAYFTQLVVFLSRRYEETPGESSGELLRIGRVLAYIEQNYYKKITLAELAGTGHMSERNLRRVFLATIGIPPSQYILQIRIAHAASLIESTAQSITEIAFSCGFEDSNYFSRQFRIMMNQSPRAYRSQQTG